MNERLMNLSRADVQTMLLKVEPQESYSSKISQELQQTVFGQSEAADAVARRLALFDTGLSDPKRPLGSMVFLGPTGVGKTEMAHAAAKQMFGDTHSDRLKIINMAEMTKDHYVTRFVGSPPSYVGFAEKPEIPHDWLHKGRSIIVLDEFEKAHPDVRQLFLGALDKGSMNARNGTAGTQPLDFRNTLFIFTSNIGGKEMHDVNNGEGGIGFKTTPPTHESKQKRIAGIAEKGLKDTLSPEFLNRIDDVIVFHEITDRSIHSRIFDKFIAYRNQDLVENFDTGIRPNPQTGEMERVTLAPQFYTTSEFKEHILDVTGNRGGREMKRELEKQLFDKAADVFMGLDVRGKPLVADIDPDSGEVVFYTDSEPPLSGEKKDNIIPFSPRAESGHTDTPETSQPPSDTGEKTKEAGEPQEDEGEEPPLDEEPPIESYDDIPGDGNNFPVPPQGLGMRIIIWDESMINKDGDVPMKWIEHRYIRLPTE